ncbi:23S rRNA (adenine(1618)-N(6))-methyltransferase RlmF [Thioclava sp. 'Guangxiensis']|uniref:23S rRNA (adenine(1618)-N(6))-methyltransferase RlmF n=1 Tax=Thioclava sp. 'Guangxiensis' TaxID=3149044 RepID=UPI003877D9E6
MASKPLLHPRNQHRDGYDFARLLADSPDLAGFTTLNPSGGTTIDFKDAKAVRALNRALLKTHYGIDDWDIPETYLCPPIPGRVDYIHYLADLLAEADRGRIPRGPGIRALDIGTGASLVYPLTGLREYGWSFTGADIDPVSIASAQAICERNALPIELRQQPDPENIFKGLLTADDLFHVTLCNPPFHASMEEAQKGTERKWRNLGHGKSKALNFGGQNAELWCEGGEIGFLSTMITQSRIYAEQCLWFTSLVSKKDNLRVLERLLRDARVDEMRMVEMAQGQKTSRFIAWTYYPRRQRSL